MPIKTPEIKDFEKISGFLWYFKARYVISFIFEEKRLAEKNESNKNDFQAMIKQVH